MSWLKTDDSFEDHSGDMSNQPVSSAELAGILSGLKGIAPSSEDGLARRVAAALLARGIDYETEAWLNDTDRIDLIVDRVGIELKLKGPVSAVTRQLARYAQSTRLDSLVLVTTRAKHRSVPRMLCGKPIDVIHVGGYL